MGVGWVKIQSQGLLERGTSIQVRGRGKWEGAFRVEEWATCRGLVLEKHGVSTGKMGSKEKSGLL